MKTSTQTILRHYLQILLDEFERQNRKGISPRFKNFFTKTELITIVRSSFDNVELGANDPTQTGLDKSALLGIIGSDIVILRHYLKYLDQSFRNGKALSPSAVWETLEQLGLQTHYLGQKAVPDWDEYDFSNYNSLLFKAGKLQTVYGIFDSDVHQKDVSEVDSFPHRIYATKELAEEAFLEGIEEKQFNEDEVHILRLQISNNN